ncbi:GBS Bsp-like repeat-containing protein [Streptococcus dentiloxodontae]
MAIKEKYTLKKSKTYGLCSVALASFFLAANAAQVSADETVDSSKEESALVNVQDASDVNDNPSSVTEVTAEDFQSAENSAATTSDETSGSASTAVSASDSQTLTSETVETNAVSEQTSTQLTVNQSNSNNQTAGLTTSSEENEIEEATVSEEAASRLQTSRSSAIEESQTSETTSATVAGKTLILQYNRDTSADEQVYFAVWTQNRDQDDLVWYQADVTGAAYIDLSRHKEYGTYNIHTYSNINGRMVGRDASTITVAQPELSVKFDKISTGNYKMTISGADDSITSISVPVWSDKNDQDDIKWYAAAKQPDGTYTVDINTSNHKSDKGHYSAHIYGQSAITGGTVGLLATSGFDNETKEATVSISGYSENSKNFTVNINGADSSKTLSSVNIAVWSEENGQDDLKWYTPAINGNSASQPISILNHGDVSGNYTVHVYTTYTDGTTKGTNLGTYKITKPADSNITTATLTESGIHLQLVSNTVTDYDKVRFAVWSEIGDQDDLRWYSAASDGTVTVPYSDHTGYGTYNIHTYLSQKSGMKGLNAATMTIANPSASASVSKVDNYTYQVTVSNVPYYMTSISVPVWSDKNDQDDIRWYQAKQKDATTWTADISLKNHNFETGTYSVHIYGNSTLSGGSTVGLGTSSFTLTDKVTPTRPNVSVTEHKGGEGWLKVTATETNTSLGIKSIQVAAWSEANQSNIHWYTVEADADGTTDVVVDRKNHSNLNGNYTVHVYLTLSDGSKAGYDLGNYDFYYANTWVYSDSDLLWHYYDESGKETKTSKTISSSQAGKINNSFLAAIYDGAVASLQYGVLPSITAAQAILESGWGKSTLSAAPNNNLFGIKASSDWRGETVTVPTQEYVNGQYVTVNAAFRKYNSWNESVLDHAKFFTETAWRRSNYSQFVGERNYKVAAQKLHEAGYATDPGYASKLINLIDTYKLYEWDTVS